jgi:transcriptional regulator with XRE-family HTH domain
MARKQHARWFLKEWRKFRGLTQDQLAERTGLSKPYISQLERGERQYTQELLERFAEELRCAAPDLIMRDPTDPDGLWSIYDQLTPPERQQGVAVLRAIRGTKAEPAKS